jgi:hypothetical protein
MNERVVAAMHADLGDDLRAGVDVMGWWDMCSGLYPLLIDFKGSVDSKKDVPP